VLSTLSPSAKHDQWRPEKAGGTSVCSDSDQLASAYSRPGALGNPVSRVSSG
jgi:hypothetical protein